MEASPARAVTVIEPQRGWHLPNLRELWASRDLAYLLARRDVTVRYKQAVIGFFWAVLQPVFIAVVFAIFLGVLQKADSIEGVPYVLLAISGLVLWLPFAKAVELSTQSTVASENLITKIYFPRVLLPITALASPAVDMVLGFIVAVVAALIYGFEPSVRILAAPLILCLALLTALGPGIWCSALNVRFRDFGIVVPFILLVGLFITPIAYPFELVTAQFPPIVQGIYSLNPMVGVIEAFRWALLGTEWPGLLLVIPVISSVFLLVTGALYFQKAERSFADVI